MGAGTDSTLGLERSAGPAASGEVGTGGGGTEQATVADAILSRAMLRRKPMKLSIPGQWWTVAALGLGACTPTGSSSSKTGPPHQPADTGDSSPGTYTDLPEDTSAPEVVPPADQSIYAPLRINEFMASNESAWSPDDGATFPDWIELINTGDATIGLAGVGITDDLEDPSKGVLSADLSLEPGAVMLLLATGTATPSGVELPFKLSAEGEAIGLFTPAGLPVHLLTYEAQRTDYSAALAVDGDRESGWIYVPQGTPGALNAGG